MRLARRMRFSQSLYQMYAGTESRRTSMSAVDLGAPIGRWREAGRREALIARMRGWCGRWGYWRATSRVVEPASPGAQIAWLAPREPPIQSRGTQGEMQP